MLRNVYFKMLRRMLRHISRYTFRGLKILSNLTQIYTGKDVVINIHCNGKCVQQNLFSALKTYDVLRKYCFRGCYSPGPYF